jgi:hypothetical protein
MIEQRRLGDLAAIIRSKNAGPYRLTFDILFDDEETFLAVVESKTITRESVAALYNIAPERISSIHTLPHGLAIKVTLFRPQAQCSAGERDVYGCQQHAPLMDVLVPIGGNYRI